MRVHNAPDMCVPDVQIFLQSYGKCRSRRPQSFMTEEQREQLRQQQQQRIPTPLPPAHSQATPSLPPYVTPQGWAPLVQ
jgi:hypothetical protein